MKKLLAVQNQWDEAGYKAMLDPDRRPLMAEEQVELASYKSLHGACTSFASAYGVCRLAPWTRLHIPAGSIARRSQEWRSTADRMYRR